MERLQMNFKNFYKLPQTPDISRTIYKAYAFSAHNYAICP